MRNILIGGAVVVGGYFAWRWWQGRPVANAAQTSPGTDAGAAASSMTESAARTTVFSPWNSLRRLLPPVLSPKSTFVGRPPTSSAAGAVNVQALNFADVRAKVLSATLAPMPVAPSPSGRMVSSTGVLSPVGTQPAGELPKLGNPYLLMTRGIA